MKRTAAVLAAVALCAAAASSRIYVVRPGDTLSVIAENELGAASRWREIARRNGIENPDRIYVGMRLELPDEAAGAGGVVAEARAVLERAERALGGRYERSALRYARDEILAAEAALRAGYPEDARARADRARREIERILSAAGVGVPQEVVMARLAGPVRARASSDAPWSDLPGETTALPGVEVMTSSLGTAQVRTGGVEARLAPSGILSVPRAEIRDGRLRIDLALATGEARVTGKGGAARRVRISAGAGALELEGPFEALARALPDGGYDFELREGAGTVTSGARTVSLVSGQRAAGRPGGEIEVEGAAEGIRLLAPAEGARIAADEVRFRWEATRPAAAFRFTLRDAHGASVERTLSVPRITVTNLSEGDYTWEVRPLDEDERLLPGLAAGRFTVFSHARVLEIESVRGENGVLVVRGRAWPGATVRAEGAAAEADDEGDFRLDLVPPEAPAVLVAGLVADDEANAPVRALAAAAVLEAPVVAAREVPIVVRADEGEVRLLGGPAPSHWRLLSGENAARFAWRGPDGTPWGEATVKILADLEAPRIRMVRTTPERARPGDEVIIRLEAEDGPEDSASGLAERATFVVAGPDGFADTFAPRGTDGVFEASFRLPERMSDGILWVREIRLADRAGNEQVLTTEGLAAEIDDVRPRRKEGIRYLLAAGLGVLIGAAL